MPGNPPGSISPSLVRFRCPGDHEAGIPAEFGTVLSRAYPRAAPGLLTGVESDPAAGRLRVTGDAAPAAAGDAALLDLWVPDRGLGAPVVSGTNVTGAQARAVTGGWRVTAVATGSYVAVVQPEPATRRVAPAPGTRPRAAPRPSCRRPAVRPAAGGRSP